jgi:hypothetical protein
MKPLKEILLSPRFMREVSLLLFFFAALSFLMGILLIGAVNSEPEVMGAAVGGIVQALVYAVLGVMIRKGSITALWIAGVLFVLDAAFQLLQPSGKGLGAGIVSRGILIYVLVRYIRRERITA